jgi:hypothetical protein
MIDLFLDNYEQHSFTVTSFQSHDDSDQPEVTVTCPKEPRDRNASSGDADGSWIRCELARMPVAVHARRTCVVGVALGI